MKDTNTKINNRCKALSGVTKSIGANSNSFQRAIVLQSSHKPNKRIHGIILRYKEGLEDVGIQIKSHSIKDLIKGYCPISIIGSPYGSDSFNIFPFMGRKPMITGLEQIEILFQTQGTAINERDISVTLIIEELEDNSDIQTDKNPFYILAGTCEGVDPNKEDFKAIILGNDFSTDIKIHGAICRYKNGLDAVGIDIYSNSIERVGGLIEGEMTLSNLGSRFNSSSFHMFPFPGRKAILGLDGELQILLTTKTETVNARDVSIALVVEGA